MKSFAVLFIYLFFHVANCAYSDFFGNRSSSNNIEIFEGTIFHLFSEEKLLEIQ